MFPTLSYFLYYLTGIHMILPVPTFGFMMALAFAGAYITFRSEYRRKERQGFVRAWVAGPGPAASTKVLTWGLVGFFAGAKAGYLVLNRSFYTGSLRDVLFSSKGSLAWGLVLGAAAVGLGLLAGAGRRPIPETREPIPETRLVHPYELMDTLLFYCGVFGLAGAIIFAKLEYTGGFWAHPLEWLFTYNGLSYYGALIFGATTYLFINYRHHIRLAVAADTGSPGMMLAYGIGRMGCHLAGDGDWGIVNLYPKPTWLAWAPDWVWSFRFPHNVIHEGAFIPGCVDNYCSVLVQPVYPTSFYESILCLLLFGVLWGVRGKIRQPGLMFAVYALLNGTERFFIEFIKINPKYALGGLDLSQAQWIALGWIGIGIGIGTWVMVKIKKTDQ